MKIFRHQFEVRYTPILAFADLYKSVFNKYLKIADFRIQKEGTIEEFIVVRFKKENFQIDCRWDRIIFLSQGDRNDISKPQGPLFKFFEILKELSSDSKFGLIRDAVLSIAYLEEDTGSFEEIVKKFKEKYISNYSFDLPEFSEDYGIMIEFENKGKIFKQQFGPFNYKTDINTHNLTPLYDARPEEFKDFSGLIVDTTYYEKIDFVDFDTFKRFERFIFNSSKKVHLK
jgi:hypothetical protein